MKTHYFCPKDKKCRIWGVYSCDNIEGKNEDIAKIKMNEENGEYFCPAIIHAKKVKEDAGLYPEINIECAFVETLNNQENILKKLNELSNKLK
jgi:hypothetical protein